MKQSRRLQLLTLLLATGLAMTVFGALLRGTVGQKIPQLQGIPAPAVPLALLADPTLLQAAQMQETQIQEPGEETLSKPGTDPVPEQPDAAGQPSEPSAAPESGSRLPEVQPEPTEPEAETTDPPESGAAEDASFGTVDVSYFDDALFIGDSRTVGLSQYGRLGGADYFADTGMTVFNVLTQEAADTDFSRQTLPELLGSQSYGKIYLMLGINEIGYPFESLLAQYQTVVETLRELQPDALLILCANLHVTRATAASTPRLEPDNIESLDAQIAAMADGQQIFYLDVNPAFCDEEGYLRDDMTGDGVHPYGTGYALWAEWLLEHGIQ